MSYIASYNLDSLVTPERSRAFLKDMWNPNYGQGQYFSALHELDEHMFTPIKLGDNWLYSPHAIYDGLALLDNLNSEHPELKLDFSLSTPFSPPKGWTWFKALISALTSKPVEQHLFIQQQAYNKKFNQQLQIFNLEFSVEETSSLIGINLTSYILTKISKFFTLRLSMNKTTRWMVPVNIRGPFKEAPLSQMSASYIGINCSLNDSMLDVKTKLVSKLKSGEQWGYWLIGKIGLLGGKKIILNQTVKSLNKPKSDWFASFSNLGNIGGVESSPELLIMPIVRWHRPIGCVSYIYRNKLNFTASFHPSLGISEETLEEYKNEIYRSILSK
jgi:hypothetical protein